MAQTAEKTLFESLEKLSDFQRYDLEHPEIWRQFQAITFDLIRRKIEHYGAKAVFEVIRFRRIRHYGEREFKVNNNLTAYYARKFVQLHPEHKDFFEFRKARIDG